MRGWTWGKLLPLPPLTSTSNALVLPPPFGTPTALGHWLAYRLRGTQPTLADVT